MRAFGLSFASASAGDEHEELLSRVSSLRSVGGQHRTDPRMQQNRQSHHQQSLPGTCLEIPTVVDVRGSVARVVPTLNCRLTTRKELRSPRMHRKKSSRSNYSGDADVPVAHCKMRCIMNTERKVAVVTGASRGLGKGIANAFRHQGYRLVGTSRSIEPSDDPDYLTVAGDIGDPATGKMVIEKALSRFGRVDTLINNAGIFIPNEFTKYTDQQYRDLLSTNLNGFFYITQQAVGTMVQQGSGHVVQVTTTLEHANSAAPSVLGSLSKGGLAAA